MDYTTLTRVKQEIHSMSVVVSGSTVTSGSTIDDSLLSTLITAASRSWDRAVTSWVGASDYFMTESITGEALEAQINYEGAIICYPHKPIIQSVAGFSYFNRPFDSVYTVDPSRIQINGPCVTAWPANLSLDFPAKCRVSISYTGGSGSSVDDLPQDMVELVTLLATRFYRESETALSDAIGVAELGTMQYTKAWPQRVKEGLEHYRRRVGWNHVA